MERRRVIYTGQVQGVGFRYSTRRIAQRYAVTGFVRNLPNGSVELVAEGEAAEMDRFLAEVAAEMSVYIRHVETHKETPTSAYPSFEIAH